MRRTFFDQHDALRSAIRIAHATNRTLIVPRLRLEEPPLERASVRELAKMHATKPCTLDVNCIPLSWSELYNLDILEQDFGIQVREQVADEASYEKVYVDPGNSKQMTMTATSLIQWLFTGRYITTLADFQVRLGNRRWVQCGALSPNLFRKEMMAEEEQQVLYQALTTRILAVPDLMPALNQTAATIIETLDRSFMAVHVDSVTALSLMDSAKDQVTMELLSDIPIDHAVAATMPIQPSRLLDYVTSNTDSLLDRRQLLEICKEYRRGVDSQYPIVYLTTSAGELSPAIALNLVHSLFPCAFTKQDMLEWRIIQMSWPGMVSDAEYMAQVESLLAPLLDVVVVSHGKYRQK